MSELEEIVIVRGMTGNWFMNHFKDMEVYFGGDPRAVPSRDCRFLGFYLEAPDSAITHIGIVDRIERNQNPPSAVFFLRGVFKLDKPIPTGDGHGIRKQEYWSLAELGIERIAMVINQFVVEAGVG
jgi:hypothetical protein